MAANCCEKVSIVEVECVHEDGKFILSSFAACLPDLFTVRFRAPADYGADDVLVFRGKELPVFTPGLTPASANAFASGAIVHADIDLACGRAFIGIGGGAGDLSAYSTTEEVEAMLEDYARTADLPSLDGFAPLDSPEFINVPTAPTAADGDDSRQIANTEFVNSAIEAAKNPAVAFAMVPDYARQETENRISTNNGTWTVDRDGFINVFVWSGTNVPGNYAGRILINGDYVAQGASRTSVVAAVTKGDVVSLYQNAGPNITASCFYIPPKYLPVNRQYSTDEQLTGETWIDGSPIWRQTIEGTTGQVGATPLIGTIGTGSRPVRITGLINWNNQRWCGITFGHPSDGVYLWVEPTGEVRISAASAKTSAKSFVGIIEYIKP